MTERELAMGELLCGIGFTLAGIVSKTLGDTDASRAVHELAVKLEAASAAQHDEDRNGIRRAMQLEDCAEANPGENTCDERE